MIPKTIHYCWLGPEQRSDRILRCMESWSRFLPDYQVMAWTEETLPLSEPYLQATCARGQWSRASNFVRLYALYEHGGIYLDADAEVIKPLDPLLEDECFLGFQRKRKYDHWVNGAVIGAVKGQPFLKRCLDKLRVGFAQNGEIPFGPALVTSVLTEMGLKRYGLQRLAEVRLYPHEYFYPYPWLAHFHPVRIKPNTHIIHYWEHSRYDLHKIPLGLRLRGGLYDLQSKVLWRLQLAKNFIQRGGRT
jgi:mannosyltransferase OCH1-like enzyme